jgi:transcriptional regulator with XRE-family HTH domain
MNAKKYITNLDSFLGKKLRDFRERAGWTQKALSEKIGVSHQQIFKYEQGYSKISMHQLYKLTQVFGVSPNAFFEGFRPTSLETPIHPTIVGEPKNVLDILLISDDSREEFLIRQTLNSMNRKLNVYCLRNYEEVSKFLRRHFVTSPFPRPNLILLDLTVQKNSNMAILKTLKQDRQLQDIPVLVLANSINWEDVTSSYKNHAGGYIYKTFDPNVFQRALQKAIEYWFDVVILPDAPAQAA